MLYQQLTTYASPTLNLPTLSHHRVHDIIDGRAIRVERELRYNIGLERIHLHAISAHAWRPTRGRYTDELMELIRRECE